MSKPASQNLTKTVPEETLGFKLLKWSVYIMGVMLVVGTIAFGYAFYQKATSLKRPDAVIGVLPDIAIPSGYSIENIEIIDDRIAVHYKTPIGHEVIYYDPATGAPAGRIRFTQ